MLDYTDIIIDIIMYFVIFNDVYHVYTSQKLHIIILVNSVWSSIAQFCDNFYYNFFRAQIAQYQ